ncbi:MAG: tetratricopeptide repeat protein, partial [Pseudomonadota bacterium]
MEQAKETRLVGWKRIAAHLGCSERTARRWEQEESLPVHRQQHETRSTIYAVPSELDAWIASRTELAPGPGYGSRPGSSGGPIPERLKQGWIPLAASVLVLALIGGFVVATLLPGPQSAEDAKPSLSADPAAIDFYERGRAMWLQRGEVPNARAIKLLTQAVKRDDTFAEAWAALASAWLTYPTYNDQISPERAIDEALLAADRAVQLDPTLAEPRSVMASIAQRQGDWVRAEQVYRAALEADPQSVSLTLWFAGHNRDLGRMEAAERLTRAALALDPNSPPVLTETAMNLFQVGRIEESRERLDYLWFDLGLEAPIVWFGRWSVLIETGEYEAAKAWLEWTFFDAGVAVMAEYVER